MRNDIEHMVPLDALDPSVGDPRYWDRFHDAVLRAAAPELERRRRAPLTVSDLLLSWSRMIVPGAAVAAAVAGLLILPASEPEDVASLFGVEEILREEAQRASLAPVFLQPDPFLDDAFVFAVERGPGGGGL